MAKKLYLYPVIIRVWHLLNALFILALIITGLSMHYANPDHEFIAFPISTQIHNISGIGITLNYLLFFLGNLITKNGRHYRIIWKGYLSRLKQQFYYYTFGIFKGQQPPFPINEKLKFNPLQQFSYVLIMYCCLPLLIISGLGLLFPETVLKAFLGLGGVFLTDLLHITIGFLVTLFLLIHLYFCTIGHTPTSNFKSMVTGYHEIH